MSRSSSEFTTPEVNIERTLAASRASVTLSLSKGKPIEPIERDVDLRKFVIQGFDELIAREHTALVSMRARIRTHVKRLFNRFALSRSKADVEDDGIVSRQDGWAGNTLVPFPRAKPRYRRRFG